MSVVNSELCDAIGIAVASFQKISIRTTEIRKPEKIYTKRGIPRNEQFVAYCGGTIPLLRMTTGYVIFTDQAFYPPESSGFSPNRVPYPELCRYIATQNNDHGAAYLRNSDGSHEIYMSTLFVKNIAGHEIKALLEEIQAFYCSKDDAFRSKYQKTIESVFQRAKEESRAGVLSDEVEAMLLTLAERGNTESADLLAESQFRRCNVDKYKDYIQNLPIDQDRKERYLNIPSEFYSRLRNDLSNPQAALSEDYLHDIVTTINNQNDTDEAQTLFYRTIAALALCRIDPIAARAAYQELQQDYSSESWNLLEDMMYLCGSKNMLCVYNQLAGSGETPPDCNRYIDGLNLTPLHYALILGKDDLAVEWAADKKCSFAHDLAQTSEIGLWSYGVLAEIRHSSQTEALLLNTVPELIEMQAEIARSEKDRALCEIKQQALQSMVLKIQRTLKEVRKGDPDLSLKTDEIKARIENAEEQYRQLLQNLEDVNSKIKQLTDTIGKLKFSLKTSRSEMLEAIRDYLNALPSQSSPLDSFIMQIYLNRDDGVSASDILKQTSTATILRMYCGNGYSVLLPASVHLDAPYRTIRVTDDGIEDDVEICEEDTNDDETQTDASEDEFEEPQQPYADSWFSEQAHRDAAVLKNEYRVYAKKYHPDVCDNEAAHEAFLTIKEEYEYLSETIG